MPREIPRHQPRTVAIGYGLLLLAWLTPEDATVLIVSLLGAGLSLLLVTMTVIRWSGGQTLTLRQWFPGLILGGGLVGFGAVWCTIGLMIFKNAWHGHALPDFPSVVVVGIWERLLPWTIAGALVGGAAALLLLAQSEN